MVFRLSRLTILFYVLLVIKPIAAVAQPPLVREPDRPFQGIFRGNQRDLQSPQALSIRLALVETYDGNIIATDSVLLPANVPKRSGTYTHSNAGAFYSKRHPTTHFVADRSAGF